MGEVPPESVEISDSEDSSLRSPAREEPEEEAALPESAPLESAPTTDGVQDDSAAIPWGRLLPSRADDPFPPGRGLPPSSGGLQGPSQFAGDGRDVSDVEDVSGVSTPPGTGPPEITTSTEELPGAGMQAPGEAPPETSGAGTAAATPVGAFETAPKDKSVAVAAGSRPSIVDRTTLGPGIFYGPDSGAALPVADHNDLASSGLGLWLWKAGTRSAAQDQLTVQSALGPSLDQTRSTVAGASTGASQAEAWLREKGPFRKRLRRA